VRGQEARHRSPFARDVMRGETALITGGSKGIGRGIATYLGRHGARVLVTSRDSSAAETVARELQGQGLDAAGYRLEVCDRSSIENLAERVWREHGPINLLVNNAGTNIPEKALDVSEESWDVVQGANLKGTFFMSQAIARRWVDDGARGAVVNISSQAGLVAIDKRAAYCSSKAGVVNLTRELALEWAEHGIRVNSVAPTFVLTPMTEPMFADPSFRDEVMSMIPLGRAALPEEVGAATLFLASPAAELITGHTLVVDGGWTIH
jgi:NAD(P)-dependent dehydrogenase (short-subunit alcohol dehydrogenase family)